MINTLKYYFSVEGETEKWVFGVAGETNKSTGNAKKIEKNNEKAQNTKIEYKGYTYYRENSSLDIHIIIEKILYDINT